ncbi:MAG: biotin synthase BioB, partial [Microthrixaceae bacterium]
VNKARDAGLSPCSGALFGMGESDDDIVEVAYALRDLDPDSVPINFLIPIDGTPMAGRWELNPQRCLRILALYRYMFPDTEIRIAGGREVHLRSVQGLGLELANSIFVGDYLTTEGQAANADLELLSDWGFEPLELPGGPVAADSTSADTRSAEDGDQVRIRRRGVGTDVAPNA